MTDIWLPNMNTVPITNHGYGPFKKPFNGWVLHVNESNGRLEQFFKNSNDVTPNFQIYKEGPPSQYLPLDWQPWCQSDGNQTYAACETEGFTGEPLNVNQLNWLAVITKAYHDHMGMPYAIADEPGQQGIGVHYMGGVAWGGHTCPGPIRAGQRSVILGAVPSGGFSGGGDPITLSVPVTPKENEDMTIEMNRNRQQGTASYGAVIADLGGAQTRAVAPPWFKTWTDEGRPVHEMDEGPFIDWINNLTGANDDHIALIAEAVAHNVEIPESTPGVDDDAIAKAVADKLDATLPAAVVAAIKEAL